MNSASVSSTVAANCRAEAARHGKTALDIADGTGIHRVTLGRRLSGTVPFTVDELVAIATYLGIPLSTLLAGVEAESPAKASA